MKRPVIAITVDNHDTEEKYESPMAYARAVERAGGLPLLLPYRADLSLIPAYIDLLDGILFTGGDDLNPALYGQSWHPLAKPIDSLRQAFELALLAEVERRRLPALGICLGSQLMNVHRGGSLHQFLPDVPRRAAIEHRKLADASPRHPVALAPSSLLRWFIGRDEISVNTAHKQAIDRLGRGLQVMATAPDGIIEAFQDPTYPFFIAVQWHPERLLDEPGHLVPFQLLVNAAGKGK